MGFGVIKLASLIIVMVIFSCISSLFLRYYTMKPEYFLSIHCKSSIDSITQVFFDTGSGFNQVDSSARQIFSSDEFKELTFFLPPRRISRLRLDPLPTEGEFQIREAAIVRSGGPNGEHEILHRINLEAFSVTTDLLISKSQSGISLKSVKGAVDPISEISLSQPLDDWDLTDFLDREFLTKAFLLFVVLAPVVLVTSHPGKRSPVVRFVSAGNQINLQRGQIHLSDPDDCYRDAPTDTLEDIIFRIERGDKWQAVLREQFEEKHNWLYRVITSKSRSLFLRQRKIPKRDHALDIGAGWGQFSIPLAKTNQVCSLEPTPERLKFIRTVSRQEGIHDNMSFVGADYLDVEFQTKFDLILCIGVLEWVGCFRKAIDPIAQQRTFLKKIKSDLKDGGRVIIGIENRVGLKYLLGVPDDHTGLSLVSCMRSDMAKKLHEEQTGEELKCFTYTMREYEEMLVEAGFTQCLFFAAFPDYKLPEKIFPVHGKQCSLNEYLSDGNRIIEHNGRDGCPLAEQDKLNSIYSTLASKKVAHNFAPSFYIEAS